MAKSLQQRVREQLERKERAERQAQYKAERAERQAQYKANSVSDAQVSRQQRQDDRDDAIANGYVEPRNRREREIQLRAILGDFGDEYGI